MYIHLGEATSSGITLAPLPFIPTPTLPSLRVITPLGLPYRHICRIFVRNYDNDDFSVGTGVLVSPSHVLTCAHVIYPPQTPRTSSIDVFPGQNGPDESVLRFRSNGWATSPSWQANDCRTAGEDYGLIRLPTPTRQGFMPLRPFNPAILPTIGAQVAGYPSDREARSRHMYESRGQVAGAMHVERCVDGVPLGSILRPIPPLARTLIHWLDTTKGQSGSPLWIDDGTTQTLIGLHVGLGNQDGKLAVLLNAAVQAQVQYWMRNTLPPI